MKNYSFKNENRVDISAGPANVVSSTINVQNTGGSIQDVNIKLDIEHTWTSDLIIKLIHPSGTSAILVSGKGGSGDNLFETLFDDDANDSIDSASPPFHGRFRPTESFAVFNNLQANGIWTLEISDTASQDGGALKTWELEIVTDEVIDNTGPFVFHNRTPRNISDQGPNSVQSQINVQGLNGVSIDAICVSVDIEHSYTSDLQLKLTSPGSTQIALVNRQGGSGDNFENTVFDDEADISINNASPPFNGTFRPFESLSEFHGEPPNGVWTLTIEDKANLDGGILKSWSISIKSDATPVAARPFEIKVNFLGGLTQSQMIIFQNAADRWSEVITGDLQSINTDAGVVDDVLIDAEGSNIDGEGGILGQAGPTFLRPGNLLPARGIMRFDSSDLQKMEDEGELLDVIIHEMGHVLGIGTLWARLGLIQGSGTNDPVFTGLNARREYAALKHLAQPLNVPIANTGGSGTREGHWRESVFDSELMTGFDDPGRNALSRLTVASLQDLGYQVDYNNADAYILPFGILSPRRLAAKKKHVCNVDIPECIVLPEENLIS